MNKVFICYFSPQGPALPTYIHPLSPTYSAMVTSTPVRLPGPASSSFVFGGGAETETSGEHSRSIGDIVEGNFVSFSASELYCTGGEETSVTSEAALAAVLGPDNTTQLQPIMESGEDREEHTEDLEDGAGSLCEQCRSSICSTSSTLTLTQVSYTIKYFLGYLNIFQSNIFRWRLTQAEPQRRRQVL